ncbi:hypothetical protein [Nocardia sp. Marseille-Q1738]
MAERLSGPPLAALAVLMDPPIADTPDRPDAFAVEAIGVPALTVPRSNTVGASEGRRLPTVGMGSSAGNSAVSPVPGRDPPDPEVSSRTGICGVSEVDDSTMFAPGVGMECDGTSGASGRPEDVATMAWSAELR